MVFILRNSTTDCFTFQKCTTCAFFGEVGFAFEIDKDMHICQTLIFFKWLQNLRIRLYFVYVAGIGWQGCV